MQVPGGTPIPVYVAAMGPKALRVTGELADGTLPYLAGPRTIEEFIVPGITEAAAEAGRPAPRVIAAVPVLLSDDVEGARTAAAQQLSFYEAIPSYRNVIAEKASTVWSASPQSGPKNRWHSRTPLPRRRRHRSRAQPAGPLPVSRP